MDALPFRRKNRLSGDLYQTPGAYFITICTRDRVNLFWIDDGQAPSQAVMLTNLGRIAEDEMLSTFTGNDSMVHVEKYVVMPNHVHMLLLMKSSNERACPDIRYAVRLYKRKVTQRAGFSVWQKGFYDHIVRSDREYLEIWTYIDNNPKKWRLDRYCPYAEETDRSGGDEDIAPTP